MKNINNKFLHISYSKIDEERFGIKTILVENLSTKADILKVNEYCIQNNIKFVIARCDSNNLNVIQDMEQKGYYLTDTLVYYKFDLKKTIPTISSPLTLRKIKTGEETEITQIAKEAFKDYFGHYHADRKLNNELCNAVYVDWAYKSCTNKNIADEVIVAEKNSTLIGFATIKMNSVSQGEVKLNAVTPSFQKQGVYRQLIIQSLMWCKTAGANQMIISTQINNIAVQKVWSRLGFEPFEHTYTLHKWFHEFS